jgi:hypothetical protein
MIRHLLHIGFPKAGSMFLRKWFKTHPQLAYADGAVAGFRNVWEIARDAAKGGAEPLYRVTSSESFCLPFEDVGQRAVDYKQRRDADVVSAQAACCRTLAALFPASLVLVVTRGYRSMILSSYSQLVRSGGFVGLDRVLDAMRTPEVIQRSPWNYDRVMALYRNAFGQDNVIVMPYELLRDDTRRFTDLLAQRLGIDSWLPHGRPINESLSPAELYWYPRIGRIACALRPRRLFNAYVWLSFENRLRRPIRMLERLRPLAKVTSADIPDDVVETYRGTAECLRDNELYVPYRREYLLEP